MVMIMMTVDDNDDRLLMNVDDNDDRLAPNGHLRVYQALAAGFWSVSRVGICKFFFNKKSIFSGNIECPFFVWHISASCLFALKNIFAQIF